MNYTSIHTSDLQPFEMGEQISKRQWYTTMYFPGFLALWRKTTSRKDYVRAIVTKTFLSGMDQPEQILTLIRAWGRKHHIHIDEEKLLHETIPEQDAFTKPLRQEWKRSAALKKLMSDKDKLSTKIREHLCEHGTTSRQQLCEAVGVKPETMKDQLERLLTKRQIVKEGRGKYNMTPMQREGFSKLLALRQREEAKATKVFIVQEHCGFKGNTFWSDDLWKQWRRLGVGTDGEGRDEAFLTLHPEYSHVHDQDKIDQIERERLYEERMIKRNAA